MLASAVRWMASRRFFYDFGEAPAWLLDIFTERRHSSILCTPPFFALDSVTQQTCRPVCPRQELWETNPGQRHGQHCGLAAAQLGTFTSTGSCRPTTLPTPHLEATTARPDDWVGLGLAPGWRCWRTSSRSCARQRNPWSSPFWKHPTHCLRSPSESRRSLEEWGRRAGAVCVPAPAAVWRWIRHDVMHRLPTCDCMFFLTVPF